MVTLETVEIPGLREAIKREAHVRDTAFLDGLELLCGVEVVPLSLRRLIWLEQAHNGFVVPWTWDDAAETYAHAIQFLYYMKPDFSPPRSPMVTFWQSFLAGWKEQRFINSMRRKDRGAVVKEISSYLSASFMDAPSSGGEVQTSAYASYPSYIVDLFAEGGLTFTYDEIMDMPLARLWQHYRICSRRTREAKLTNPSDSIVVDHLAGVNK